MSKIKKNIILISPFFSLGGAETQVYQISKGFQEGGHNVIVLAFSKKSGLLEQKLNKIGIKTGYIPYELELAHQSGFRKITTLLNVILYLRKLKPDYLFPFTYYPNIVCSAVWRFTGAKKCYWNQRGLEHNTFLFLERLASLMKPSYLANSNACADYIKDRHKISEIEVIRNGINKIKIKNNRSFWETKINKQEGEKVFTMVANFFPEKNHEYLLRNWKEFYSSNLDGKYKLVLTGYPPRKEILWYLKSLVLDLNIENVVFLQSSNDIQGLLSISDFTILTSKSEGCSNFVLESLVNQIPIILSDIPANKEIFNFNYKYFFSIKNEFDLANKLKEILSDVDLKSLTDNNLKMVENRFNFSLLKKNYLKIVSNGN